MPTVKQLSRIFSKDDSLNRLQDQLASALNPILREIKGDLSGPLESPTVSALRGRPIANVAPAVGQTLVYDGLQWVPGSGSGGAVTAVTATSPLASSGGTTPDISLTGVVDAANGGTGLSSPGTAGYVLTSTGTAWTSAPVQGTDVDVSIVLLMAGTGSAGSTTFPDTSVYQGALTPAGNTQIAASPSVFGGGSVYFDGNGDYIASAINSLYTLGTGDFTIEGWIYPVTYGGGGFSNLAGCIFTFLNIAGFITTTGELVALNENGAIVVATTTGTIPLNAWTFFTFVRESGVLKIYINGTLDVSASFTTDVAQQTFTIGSDSSRQANTFLKFNGYMNDFRISRRARYTGSFSAPTSLFPVPSAGWAFPSGAAGGILGYPNSWYPNPSGLIGISAVAGAENTIKIGQPGVGGASVIRWDPYGAPGGNTGSIIGPQSYVSGGTAFLFPGGTMLVEGGQGTPFSGGSDGGVAKLRGGRGTGVYRSGAAVVEGGLANTTPAGHAYVNGGYSGGTSATDAGNVYINGGAASDLYGGSVNIDGGGGRTAAGEIVVTGGSATNPAYNSPGANCTVRGGAATGTGNGGDVYVRGGAVSTGTKGRAYVGDTNTSAVYLADSAIKTHVEGPTVFTPPATQTISAATYAFTPDHTLIPFTVSGGSYTLTSTPTIATAGAVIGQTVLLMNIGTTHHIALNRGTAEALSLRNPAPQIDPGGSMLLVFDGTYWVEVAHTQNTTT